jgi:hypothetical protein
MVKVTDEYRRTPHPPQRFARLAFLLVLLAGLAWGLSTLSNDAQSAPNIPVQTASLSDIPIAAHRRAAQHLEEVRFTEMAPGWDRAVLGDQVRFLYRPDDLQNPAYYEIPVIIPENNNMPAGFIILAANENDFPIPHWDFTGESPTQQLDKMSNYTAAIYYKLDTLSYLAEDAQGNIVATLGQLPPKIEGMNMDWLDQKQELGEATWIPDENLGDDGGAGTISGTLVVSGTVTPPAELKITAWESWDALKAGYTESYGVFLEDQRRQASKTWQAEMANSEYGIVLVKSQIYDMAMLWTTPTVTLDGPGLAYITTQTVTQGAPLLDLFRITVADTVPLGFTPFTATVTYGNEVQETVRFQIVEQRFVYLPLVLLNHTGSTGATAPAAAAYVSQFREDGGYAPTAVSGWSSWNYFWAGSHDDQRLYDQIPAGSTPNTSDCWSGCGATAWGMLFGWADNQAANGNAYWASRWGLYRENGGYGTNVVAPRYWDTGVKNMIWEIRQRIGTFCAFGNGATTPWDMSRASGYLAGRTGTRLSTNYNVIGIHEDGLRERARDSIIYRNTPAIIGTGWLTHYPLAYGYRWRSRQQCFIWCWTDYDRQFYVNQGWGGSGNGWISAGTWFDGEIRP